MAFTVSDDMIWATYVFFTALFSLLAMWFPLRFQGSWKSPAGEVWTHLRAMIFPFLAAAMWYQMAGLSLADYADVGDFFFFCWGMFFVFLVVGTVMVFYLALRPIAEVLEGRPDLTD